MQPRSRPAPPRSSRSCVLPFRNARTAESVPLTGSAQLRLPHCPCRVRADVLAEAGCAQLRVSCPYFYDFGLTLAMLVREPAFVGLVREGTLALAPPPAPPAGVGQHRPAPRGPALRTSPRPR